MRKNLFALLASFAACATVTAGVVASTAHAQPGAPAKPMFIALTSSAMPLAMENAAPPASPGPAPLPPPGHVRPERRDAFCRDAYAHSVGQMAYMEARLNLSPAEQPLFEHWKAVKLDIAKRNAAACSDRPEPARLRGKRPSPVDVMAREEDRLKARLADIDAERPALKALYDSLTPAQKLDFDHAGPAPGLMGRRMFAGGFGPHAGMPMPPPGPGPGDTPPAP